MWQLIKKKIRNIDRDVLYGASALIFFVLALAVIAWIDRRELDKKVNDKVAAMCVQKSAEDSLGATDVKVENKYEAVNALGEADNLMRGVQQGISYTQ